MMNEETKMTKQITAMDMIYSDPIIFVTYRMGILQTRMETLRSRSVYSAIAITEYGCYEEELSAYKHMYELLKKTA
jgi:hypothetical protein